MSKPTADLSAVDGLLAQGDHREAIALLKAAIRRSRAGILSRVKLGRAHLAVGEIDAALDVLKETVVLAPDSADVALALGDALMAAGHLPVAVAEFERAARLAPDEPAPRYALGLAWLEAGEPDRAIEFLSQLAEFNSEFTNDAARKIAEAEALKRAERAPQGYVRYLFDQFSADYDKRMLRDLNYRAHKVLRGLFDLVGGTENRLDILDLGCGTGLTGESFKDLARGLHGVDLSPRMLDEARRRGIYDSLVLGDIETVLADLGYAYDLILAGDTLVYLGDLGSTLKGAHRRLRSGGFFLFTVEQKDGSGFEIGAKRRYRHSESYLRNLAADSGFDVMGLMQCSPRTEAQKPVEGLAVALQRP